jgi:hypothetical protein
MTEYPTRVRIATAEDEEEIMELCRELHEENGLFSLNEEKVRETLRKAFNRQGNLIGVIGEKGSIQAVVCMILSSFWYSDDPHWEELWAYVVPEYRKSNNAKDLIAFAKWTSENSNMPLLMGIMSDHRTEGKVKLYERQFSKPFGAFFLYNRESIGQCR